MDKIAQYIDATVLLVNSKFLFAVECLKLKNNVPYAAHPENDKGRNIIHIKAKEMGKNIDIAKTTRKGTIMFEIKKEELLKWFFKKSQNKFEVDNMNDGNPLIFFW